MPAGGFPWGDGTGPYRVRLAEPGDTVVRVVVGGAAGQGRTLMQLSAKIQLATPLFSSGNLCWSSGFWGSHRLERCAGFPFF